MTLHRGKIASPKEIGPIRELTRDELELLKAPRPKSTTVATLRDSHHRVARLFAMGLRKHQVHEKSGYSLGRLGALQVDPSFQNLVAEYRNMVDESWKKEVDEFYDLAVKNKLTAERMIADQLEAADADEATPIPLKTLVAIVADRADRTGHGKKLTNVNVNIDLGSRLERARVRASQVIDGQVLPPQPPARAPRLVEAATSLRPPIVEPTPKVDRAEGPLEVVRRRVIA